MKMDFKELVLDRLRKGTRDVFLRKRINPRFSQKARNFLKIADDWGMALFSLLECYQPFGGICSLCLQVRRDLIAWYQNHHENLNLAFGIS